MITSKPPDDLSDNRSNSRRVCLAVARLLSSELTVCTLTCARCARRRYMVPLQDEHLVVVLAHLPAARSATVSLTATLSTAPLGSPLVKQKKGRKKVLLLGLALAMRMPRDISELVSTHGSIVYIRSNHV